MIRARDWSATPLGPRSQWPEHLRTALHIVLESPLPMALFWGRELVLLYNDAYRAIAAAHHPFALGRPARELSGRDAMARAAVLERGESVLLEHERVAIERRGLRVEAPYNLSYCPVRAQDGGVAGCLLTLLESPLNVRGGGELDAIPASAEGDETRAAAGAGSDLRARARTALDALRQRERQFRSLIENLYSAVALVDAGGRFTLYNARFRELFSIAPEDDIDNVNSRDWSAWEVVNENGRVLEVDEHPVRKAALTHEPVKNSLVGVRSPGAAELRWMLVSAAPLVSEQGVLEQLICTYHEITELKRAQEQLKESDHQLREADRRKNEFMAVLSHELRNPLAPIRNSVYVLEHAEAGGERARRALKVIDRQAGHMTRLVEDLLDVTRISRGKITLARERVDISALARRTAEDHRELFASSGLSLESDGDMAPLFVHGDPTRLAQVIGNLLNNSAKFTPRGGHTRLSVAANAWGQAVIRVKDDGAGICADTLTHLFEPFMQGAQTIERTRGGLGLGLALVKGLVEMHGGSVSAFSAGEGRGSEFIVTLPLQPDATVLCPTAPAAGRRASTRRVLVIEDNVDAAESLREALELGDHEVRVAYSGPDGIEAAREAAPDVVLCDIGLPGMDGYEVARILRADASAPLRAAYLVALSGYAQQEDVLKSKEAGFDRHVAKPLGIDALERLLTEAPPPADVEDG